MSGAVVGCVVPALNAAPTLGTVIAGLRRAVPGVFVVAIDDGSEDATQSEARATADLTLSFTRNRGKGAALRAGISVAVDNGCDTILTVDADGQHDTTFAPMLVSALEHADLAIGARQRTPGAMPLGRRITNRLSASAVSRCIGQPVADAQSGFRALRASVARDVQPASDRYEFETEFLILAARRGHRVTFVPIPTHYPRTVPSQFRPVRDSARIVETIWRYRPGARA